jgi:glycosyltransferase involved in cell wall biosynthesis
MKYLNSKKKKTENKHFKVLMIAPTPFFADRGCHVKIYEEIKAFSRRNIKVVLVTYHIGRDIAGIDIRRILRIPWYNKLEAGPSIHKYYLDIILAIKAIFVALKFKPDIIHAHLHEGVFVGKFVKFFIKKPIIADYQGSMTGEMLDHGFINRKKFAFRFNFWLESIINKFPDKIVLSSTNAADYLLDNFNLDNSIVTSFVEGTDTDSFHPNYDISELRSTLKLPKDKKIIIYLGVLTKYQGIDIFIESIPNIVKRYPKVHFLIVGHPNISFYQKMAEDLNVKKHITFTGKVRHEDTPKYLCLGDIAVSLKLSKTEANGKLFGYMATGLPSIVFDAITNREILGDTGVYAEYANKDSFIEKTLLLLNNEKIAKDLGEASRKRVLDNFTWDKTSAKYLKIYKELTGIDPSVSSQPNSKA